MQILADTLLFASTFTCWVFAFSYQYLAEWHRSQLGRHIMLTTLMWGLVFTYLSLIHLDIINEWATEHRAGIGAIIFGLTFLAILWRLGLLLRVQVVAHRRKTLRRQNDTRVS